MSRSSTEVRRRFGGKHSTKIHGVIGNHTDHTRRSEDLKSSIIIRH
jgi:hypothetical protein